MLSRSLVILLIGFFASCSPKPYDKARKIQEEKVKEVITQIDLHQAPALFDTLGNALKTSFIPTVNFGSRKPNFVIIHHTAQDSLQQTVKTFTLEHTQVSAHYVVGRDGEVVQMLSDDLRAWHAGNSKWGNTFDMNSSSIGIELDNNGFEPFSDAQISSLLILLKKLKTAHNIPTQNFIGHGDVAPTRKGDPSILFPWKILADAGFGFWYNVPNTMPPTGFDVENSLRRIGYDTRNLPAAIVAFKRHFVQLDISPIMSDWNKCVLFNLYWKY